MNSKILEQLFWLKTNTIRTGAIHEAQALQLRNYPLLLPNASSSSVTVDVENKKVEYNVEISKFKNTKKVKNVCEQIQTWTRTILWDDTNVVIKVNNKTVFGLKDKK